MARTKATAIKPAAKNTGPSTSKVSSRVKKPQIRRAKSVVGTLEEKSPQSLRVQHFPNSGLNEGQIEAFWLMMEKCDTSPDAMIRMAGILKKMDAGILPVGIVDGNAVFMDGKKIK